MASGADGVLQGLIELAGQDYETVVTVRTDGFFVSGRIVTATAYRAALTEMIGKELEIQGFDDAYLHLKNADVAGHRFIWYRCPLTAVQGIIVDSVAAPAPTPAP